MVVTAHGSIPSSSRRVKFYERIGYTCYAELPDYPAGCARYFMKKALRAVP